MRWSWASIVSRTDGSPASQSASVAVSATHGASGCSGVVSGISLPRRHPDDPDGGGATRGGSTRRRVPELPTFPRRRVWREWAEQVYTCLVNAGNGWSSPWNGNRVGHDHRRPPVGLAELPGVA